MTTTREWLYLDHLDAAAVTAAFDALNDANGAPRGAFVLVCDTREDCDADGMTPVL